MKNILTLFTATVLFSLLPSVSQAVCVATGTIPAILVASPTSTMTVKATGALTDNFNFTTANLAFLNAALIAESSHITVRVTGNAAACGAVVGNVSQGGAVVSILVSP